MGLEGASLASFSLRDIEDNSVRMKLRRSVAVHWPGGIVFKFGGHKFARSLGRMAAADPRLCVAFQFVQGNANTLAMSLPDTLISTYKRGKRNRFRCGESRIPSGAVFGGCDLLPILLIRGLYPMLHELVAGLWMLALRQTLKLFGFNKASKSPLVGKPALPLAKHLSSLIL
jgi:hypothetical protein